VKLFVFLALALLCILADFVSASETITVHFDDVTPGAKIVGDTVVVRQFVKSYAIALFPTYETDPKGDVLRSQVDSGSSYVVLTTPEHKRAMAVALRKFRGSVRLVGVSPIKQEPCNCGDGCSCGPDCPCRSSVESTKTTVITQTPVVRIRHRYRYVTFR